MADIATPRTETCPMCGRENAAGAQSCPGCGEPLDGQKIWRWGKLLVMRKDAQLPDRCVKTNSSKPIRVKETLYWHHPAQYFWLALCLVPYLVAATIVQQSAVVELGLSEILVERHLWLKRIRWTSAVVGLLMFLLGFALEQIHDVGGLLAMFSIPLVLTTYWATSRFVATVTPRKITQHFVVLKGVCPEYLNHFPHWPE